MGDFIVFIIMKCVVFNQGSNQEVLHSCVQSTSRQEAKFDSSMEALITAQYRPGTTEISAHGESQKHWT